VKAIRIHHRGGPEQFVYEDAPQPRPAAGEALIRVHAAGVTPTELGWSPTWTTATGADRLPVIPSHEVAGVVAAVGPEVTVIATGDPVYGLTDFYRDGAAAEYVVAQATDLAPKPRTLDYVKAAAVPLSALTAWQSLFDHAGLAAGQRVLIHGAAGGVGSFAVQLARWRGAHVIGTASASNTEFVGGLGAHEVIDYRLSRFEDTVHDVDVVLDTIGGETQERSFTVLRQGGTLVSIVNPPSAEQAATHHVRGLFSIVEPNRDELIQIAHLIDDGIVRTVVSEVFPLSQARAAYEQGLAGHNRGKVVLRVAD
jgi:NADPH:quinone reductase-like Zn-dependent oxidoreductase